MVPAHRERRGCLQTRQIRESLLQVEVYPESGWKAKPIDCWSGQNGEGHLGSLKRPSHSSDRIADRLTCLNGQA